MGSRAVNTQDLGIPGTVAKESIGVLRFLDSTVNRVIFTLKQEESGISLVVQWLSL